MNTSTPAKATRAALLRAGRDRLAAAGVDTPQLDARLLLQHAAELTHVDLLSASDIAVNANDADRFLALVDARSQGVPVAHLTGRREFWGLLFETGPGALVPRPDTETLVEAVLPHVEDDALVADLGAGTGCILAALLHERSRAFGIAVDLSPDALALAARNLARHAPGRAALLRGQWADALGAGFDAIVSNPPYIVHDEMAGLPREVRRDPMLALDGGADGLDAYRALIPSAARALRSGGRLGLEIGRWQEEAVGALLERNGFGDIELASDLAGITRALTARQA